MSDSHTLFVSPVQPIGGCSPNVYSWNKRPARVRIAMSFLNHPGLRFLGANLPCKILEYPTQEDFTRALLDPPEILGISFYINETETVLQMVKQARAAGVKQVWAGNFGAYSPEVASAFDRVFHGWSEHTAAQAIGNDGCAGGRLIHPEIYGAVGTNIFPWAVVSGLLFTSRGCPYTCNFCQTPDFYGKAASVPLESIDEILWTYHRRGVRGINVLDENFGTFPKHASAVIELLYKYRMRWIALTRVDTLLKHFDEWQSKGLFGAHLGIESLNQSSLTGASKRINQTDSLRLLEKMRRHNMFVQAFYILGFEQDTVDSITADVEALARLDLDVVQVQVLTPYPRTDQRATIESKYGIHDFNLSKFNSRNLVWNHPNISPAQMLTLQKHANDRLVSSGRALRTLAKFSIFGGRPRPTAEGPRLVLGALRGQGRRLHRELAPQLKSARRWAQRGWVAYEEVESHQSLTAHRPVPAVP